MRPSNWLHGTYLIVVASWLPLAGSEHRRAPRHVTGRREADSYTPEQRQRLQQQLNQLNQQQQQQQQQQQKQQQQLNQLHQLNQQQQQQQLRQQQQQFQQQQLPQHEGLGMAFDSPMAFQATRESQFNIASPNAPSAGMSEFAGFRPDANPRFWCSKDDQAVAEKAHQATGAVNDICLLGVTKFGWACMLTALAMATLMGCIPLVLAISRRRPPGVSFFSCFNTGIVQHMPPPPPSSMAGPLSWPKATQSPRGSS